MTYEANADLNSLMRNYDDAPPLLSHAICKMTTRQRWPLLTSDQIASILENARLPTPQEQLENLIQQLGNIQRRPGTRVRPDVDLIARVGAANLDDLMFVTRAAVLKGLAEGDIVGGDNKISELSQLRLTFDGWAFYEELRRAHGASKVAFMAMKFNEPDITAVFKDHFVPAVAATGFQLRTLADEQPAGLIDDQLRVAIRQARFVIADLTHHNNGAYWEAGYAEGLGKPVIYTCRKDVFENHENGTHFDTNHLVTVIWELEKLDDADNRLKNTIRATLPDEATVAD